MQEELLPLFPLAVVLLPGIDLPLHIFEDRYKEMIGLALENGTEFGVVLAADEGIARVGCTAAIERVLQEYPDGRLDIATLGRRRFAIASLDQQKSYLRAAVEFFDDDAGSDAPVELRRKAIDACNSFGTENPANEEDPVLSFRLAAPVTDLEFRQTLLMLRSETERLRKLIEYAPRYSQRLRTGAHMREVAGKNGHGSLPADSK